MSELAKAVTTYGAFVSLIYVLFIRADQKLRKPYKDELSSWLKGETEFSPNWGGILGEQFDLALKVQCPLAFSRLQLHMPSFARSAALSIGVVFILYVVYYVYVLPSGVSLGIQEEAVTPNLLIPFDLTLSLGGKQIHAWPIDLLVVFPILINIFPDYISYAETRYVLTKIAAAMTRRQLLLWVAIDAGITLLLSALAIALIGSLVLSTLLGGNPLTRALELLGMMHHVIFFWRDPLNNLDAVYLYSAFATSIWLWLFFLGVGFARFLRLFPVIFRVANKFFKLGQDVRDRPLQVIGYMILTLGTVMVGPLLF